MTSTVRSLMRVPRLFLGMALGLEWTNDWAMKIKSHGRSPTLSVFLLTPLLPRSAISDILKNGFYTHSENRSAQEPLQSCLTSVDHVIYSPPSPLPRFPRRFSTPPPFQVRLMPCLWRKIFHRSVCIPPSDLCSYWVSMRSPGCQTGVPISL